MHARLPVKLKIPQHSDFYPKGPPFTAPPTYDSHSFGSAKVLHDIYEHTTHHSDNSSIPLACSLPGDINLLDDEEPRSRDTYDGYFVKSHKNHSDKNAVRSRGPKGRKHHKQTESQAHRSKSLTQIDCLDTSAPNMVRRGEGGSEPENSPGAAPRSTFYPDRLPLPNSSEDGSNRLHNRTPKMPSQEYFSVTFDMTDDPVNEIVPAVKGVNLRDALQGLLERRGLDIGSVNVFPPSSNTPLSLFCDTFPLGGFNLHIRGKDAGSEGATIARANSTGSVPASRFAGLNSRGNSVSSAGKNEKKEKKVASGSQKGGRKNAMIPSDDLVYRKPGSNIFSNSSKLDKEKMDALTDSLNQYSQQGIPELPGLLTFSTASPTCSDAQSDPFYLEDHWSNFVQNYEGLTKRTNNQQDAIWELLHTEVYYIKTLKVIIDIFLSCLCNLQSGSILNEIDTERMFSNISEIYAANFQFWVDHMLPMLFQARNHKQLLNPIFLRDGFLRFEETFQPYIKYCLHLNGCIHYVKDNHKNNELFKTYLAWCETQKDCRKLRLVDLLVKPMQRLTKYSLLLTAIHKKTEDEDTKKALLEMNDRLSSFVCSVDATLRQRYEQERLSSIIGRIESYDAIESSNDEMEKVLKEYSVLDLTCPMPSCGNQQSRQLLMEGSGLKLRETSSSKVDVHCFLFTDMLLICKSLGKKGDKVRVIRQPYVVDRLVVQEMASGGLLLVYLNEYKVATAAFALYTADAKLWLENIKKAQELYAEAKSAAASERQPLGFLRAPDEDEDYDFPSTALLVARSPRSSSRSSLVHSHSGSVDMSDPISTASSSAAPITTSPMAQPQAKAVSIELGDLRNSSMSSDEGGADFKVRSSSVETRVSVTVTSPRPDRRAFLLGGAGGNAGTLSLSVPYLPPDGTEQNRPSGTTVIQVPLIPPPSQNLALSTRFSPRALQRATPINAKPPLVKTKNVSTGQQQQEQETQELDEEELLVEDGSEEEAVRRLNAKRACRTERRYHTADSIENLKKEKDTSIHKRLSWNCSQPTSSLGPSERLLRNKHINKCLSSESVYSSSGVSSTGSVHLSGSTDGDEEDNLEPGTLLGESSTDDDIRIDVSEVKEGISSVQITVNSGGNNKRTNDDIVRLKRFLLSSRSVEASDV